MYIHSSRLVFELIARCRYYYLHDVKKVDPVEHIEYRDHRWYKLDRDGKVIRVSMTYYELMQPHSTQRVCAQKSRIPRNPSSSRRHYSAAIG
jgi:hypothetical protein